MKLSQNQKENILIYNTLKVLLPIMDLRSVIESLTRNLNEEDKKELAEKVKTVYSKNILG